MKKETRGVIKMRSIYQKWEEKIFQEFDMTGHAKYSPSKFNLYVNCPYSAKYESLKGITPESNQEAEIGTAAHDIASAKLIYGRDSNKVKDRMYNYAELGMDIHDMVKYADEYVDFVLSHIGEYSIVRVEEMLNLSQWIPNTYGTCDCIIYEPNEVTVIDYKYGRVDIPAKDNYQLIAYACGAMMAIPYKVRPETINLVIYQPRTKGNTVKTWTISYDELLTQAKLVKTQILKIDTATLSDRKASKHCQHCGNKLCPLRLKYISELLDIDTAKEFLSDAELYNFQTIKRLVTRQLQNLENDIFELYADGEIMQDYDMQYSNGRKVWTDEEKVKQILIDNEEDVLTTPSPTQLENKIGPEKLQKLGLNEYVHQTKRKKGFIVH